MAQEVFRRYEHKYLLSESVFREVLTELERHMVADVYNRDRKPYTISNLYFDTSDDYLIRTSLSKPIYKEKLRLRGYGVPKTDSVVYLEIKKKYRGIVNKRRTTLTLSEAYEFTRTGIIPQEKPYMNRQVLREVAYFMDRYPLFPKLYLAYDRLAYFEKDNSDFRVSFDQNIRSRRYDLKLEAGDYGNPLLPDGVYLMEIKTGTAKPLWLCELLSRLEIRRQSFSKYGTEFRKTQLGIGERKKENGLFIE